jgi:hypothetical protein
MINIIIKASAMLESADYEKQEIQPNIWQVSKLSSGKVYLVSILHESCDCCQFMKLGSCKHIVFIARSQNIRFATIDIPCAFVFRGNTRAARNARGRRALARPALQFN